MTFSLIDVLILLILLSGARKGYRRGMVGGFFRIIRIIIALLLAVKYTKPIVGFLEDNLGVTTNLAALLQRLGISTSIDLAAEFLALIIIQLIVFLILGSLVGSIINWIMHKLIRGLDRIYLGKINRIIGLVISLIFRSFLILVLVGFLTAYSAVIPDIGIGFAAKLSGSINNSFFMPYFRAGFMLLFSNLIS